MELPVLTARGRTIPEAWERSLIALLAEGQRTHSENVQGESGTLDSTMVMVIEDPLAEPRVHRGMPGGLDDLWMYVAEVVDGVHDHWIAPEEGKWSYTYHKRLTDYEGVDQLRQALEVLAKAPHSRRAQGITWIPREDLGAADPPCLQRLWFRLVEGEGGLKLVMNCHWRSRDALKAAFMNLFALSELQKRLVEELAERHGVQATCGRIVDVSDSYHLYLGYAEDWKAFWRMLIEREPAMRTYTTEFAEQFIDQAKERLARLP
ncbi:MAG: thymidylate synthase [Chloroflexota bacterium]